MIRILVVEDESMVRENVLELLRAEGYSTFGARDGEEGVRIARVELPDLIVCDISMPNLDGYGMLARLSQDPLTASIPFIFLTGRSEWFDQRTGMKLGADDYITKPFTHSDLMLSVKRRLDKKKALLDMAEQRLDELQSQIEHGMPYEMMAPLSVLLAHSEALVKEDWVGTDASQVRNTARDIYSAASRLVQQLQSYTFYYELQIMAADPVRRMRLKEDRLIDCSATIREMAKAAAFSYNRESDLRLDVSPADLQVSELFLQTILEELLDRAFMRSKPGSAVEVQGNCGISGNYRLIVRDLGGRFPADVLGPGKIPFEKENHPVGLLMVQRIIELVGGGFMMKSDLQGNLVEVEIPIIRTGL